MNGTEITFNRGAVRPVQSLREGWQLIKEEYWLFLGITIVGILIASAAPLAILAGPMMCGIYICLLGRMHGEPASMNLLFRGFNYFGPSLVATILMVVPMLLVMLPVQIGFMIAMFKVMPQGPQPEPTDFGLFFGLIGLLWLAIMLLSLVLGVLFFFVYPLIVDRQLSGMEAVRLSFKAAFANFGGILGLMMLSMVMSLLGMLACYVGAFLFMPVHFAAIAVAYRQVFPARTAYDDLSAEAEAEPRPSLAAAPPSTDIREPPMRDQIQ
jgi:uncharacterized membrane protein